MDIERYLMDWALNEHFIRDRMSFIAGPRQVGKTTAVRKFLKKLGQPELYYNWDTPTVKKRYITDPTFFLEDIKVHSKKNWVALDEIHKYPKWKNVLKGYYDEFKEQLQFIVTGSAMMESFRKSGDSLVGRYFLFKMFPLGLHDISGKRPPMAQMWDPLQKLTTIPETTASAFNTIKSLLEISGFPEPLIAGSKDFCTRWREEHVSLIVKDDLRDLTKIVQLQKLETLLYLLPKHVGSPLSINSLTHPLECTHASLTTWLNALKKVYLIFSVPTWTAKLARSILKEEKYYFWDWGLAGDEGSRFENFVAVQLARAVSAWNEWGKGVFKLHYIRTKEGREVDFAISEKNRIVLLIEAKWSDTSLSPNLAYFKEKLGNPLAIQVVGSKGVCTMKGKDLWIMGIDRLLTVLP